MDQMKSAPRKSPAELYFIVGIVILLIANQTYEHFRVLITKGIAFYLNHRASISFSGILIAVFFVFHSLAYLWNRFVIYQSKEAVTGKSESGFLIGKDSESKKDIYLREEFLATHAQIIAGTGEGKTSLLMQMISQGIAKGRGMIIIDGKSDRSTMEQLYAYAVQAGRRSDFMLFSLNRPEASSTFNPFCEGTPEQIAERVFSSFNITHEHYGPLQFSALRTLTALLMRRGERPMPGVLRELLRDQKKIAEWATDLPASSLLEEIRGMLDQKPDKFKENYSGLVTALGHFSDGSTASLYNTRTPELNLMDVIRRNKIVYFQLPTMQFPFLGSVTGKLALQCLQSAISQIQDSGLTPQHLFPVYLDDFNDYLYPGFGSLLNKSRSANVGIVFSHQSLGDLDKVGPDFKDVVINNTKIKVLMRLGGPETAELFSKIIGTRTTEKSTSRRSWRLFGKQKTGDESVRETEEYVVHPNVFKGELTRGQGVVIIPYPNGRLIKKVAFQAPAPVSDLTLPTRNLPEPDLLNDSLYKGRLQLPQPSHGNPSDSSQNHKSLAA
jgi:type IV secretory pathway TraG/TraD family ATPase VirD4